ncbi:MAG: hypothetical protein R2794_01955 [Chitinophagales bacterium]
MGAVQGNAAMRINSILPDNMQTQTGTLDIWWHFSRRKNLSNK